MKKKFILLLCLIAFSSCSKNDETEPAQTTSSSIDIFEDQEPVSSFSPTENRLCEDLESVSVGTVKNDSLTELSGLVYTSGNLWAHNDSGSKSGVFKLSEAGEDLGFFELDIAKSKETDFEDISIFENKIYLADIGNNINTDERASVQVYKFEIPETMIEDFKTYELTYPDGARDAEAFFVDPVTGAFVIIEKAIGLEVLLGSTADAGVYMVDPEESNVLKRVGKIDLSYLAEISTSPIPESAKVSNVSGVITGADISIDGSVIAIRTYRSVWLFPRNDNQSIMEAFGNEPCEAPVGLEDQGEAIALNSDTKSFFTISEGGNSKIYETK